MYGSKFQEAFLGFHDIFQLAELTQLLIPIPNSGSLFHETLNDRFAVTATNLSAELLPLAQLL